MKIFFNNEIVGFSVSIEYELISISVSLQNYFSAQDRSEETWCIFCDISLSYRSAANGNS
jgi:hypothetical protein